ncbi:MAG TPA: Bax inhibitor-1/YccA family protein [Actinomycetes bacterium]|nr:Bax inhibitor-1/YccA family protein [Actinomycetes bacterium]
MDDSRTASNDGLNTRNPILAREAAQYARFNAPPVSAQELQDMYDAPSAPAALDRVGERLTIHDVVVKTAGMFSVLVVGAVVSWNLVTSAPWLVWGALILGFVLGMVNAVKREVSPPLMMLYAAVEGVFLGGLSWLYNENWGSGAGNANIVGQAVIGTLVAFGVMLALYASGRLRATPRFTKMLLIAMVSYLVIAMASLVSALFGVGQGWGFYGVSGLGLLLCVVGVGLAAFSLVLDFDAIQRMIAGGAPERESWRMAFGLVVTLVWLYLELLRLLAILQGGGRR